MIKQISCLFHCIMFFQSSQCLNLHDNFHYIWISLKLNGSWYFTARFSKKKTKTAMVSTFVYSRKICKDIGRYCCKSKGITVSHIIDKLFWVLHSACKKQISEAFIFCFVILCFLHFLYLLKTILWFLSMKIVIC